MKCHVLPAHASIADRILRAIRSAADPTRATQDFCNRSLDKLGSLRVLCIGKAAVTMHCSAVACLGTRISASLVVAPEATIPEQGIDASTVMLPSDHPFPTARSVHAAESVITFLREGDEPMVVLLSGGGSAMVSLPAEGITIDDMKSVSSTLMRAGATIHELNTVRKHLDRTKGGWLGVSGAHREIHVGVLSDVIGDRIDVISSGPFAADPSTYEDAADVLNHHAVSIAAVDRAIASGRAGLLPETPKPGDPRLDRITHAVLSSNSRVVDAASDTISSIGFSNVRVLNSQTGSASDWARLIYDALCTGAESIILGGESTVSGVPESGKGGPVQAVVLEAAILLQACTEPWMVLGLATDGIDGPTDAAGAVLDFSCKPNLESWKSLLEQHRSYDALDAVDALIRTGPTGTNMNDIVIGLKGPIMSAGGNP